jgi:hypothetical protein
VCDQKSRSEKISSAAKQLDCLIKSSLDIDGLHSVNLFCFVCIVFIPLQRGASPHHVLLQLGTLSKSGVNYLFFISFVVV